MSPSIRGVERLEQRTLRPSSSLRKHDVPAVARAQGGDQSRDIAWGVFAIAVHHHHRAGMELVVRSGQTDGDGPLVAEISAKGKDMDRLERLIGARPHGWIRLFHRSVVDEPDRRAQVRVVQGAIEIGQEQRGRGPVFENWNENEEPCVDGGTAHGVSVPQTRARVALIRRGRTGYASTLVHRPTFSISVPVRDHVDFLDTALRSLAAQRVDLQLAVLDASADDRVQQMLGARRVRVAYGYHHADAGQAAAIQEGWNQTSGDVVGWLNADDFYFPNALDYVADLFAARPEVDVVFGHAVHVSADGDFLSYFPAIDPDPQSLTGGCTICQPSCFVRRREMERVGGLDAALHYTMDWDLWFRLYRTGCRFAFLDAPLSVVRVHPATKTMSRALDRYREIGSLLAAAGGSFVSRIGTLLSFYEYDLQHRRTGLPDRMLYMLLSLVSHGYRRLRPRRARVIHGIECWTNLVRGTCRVDVPWYGHGANADITVVSDMPIDLVFSSEGSRGTLEARGRTGVVFQGAEIQGYQYVGRVPLRDHLLSVDLSAGRSPWRLLRVNAV
jgi:glycosyltransferase involved in cell wall biosynthesis